MARFIQHKQEARWFYSVVSKGYDRWINPLFWTTQMRDASLALGHLDEADGLEIVDVGAGTGFATEGILAAARPDARVTMVDQSTHQLRRARHKPALEGIGKIIGDAEELPFADDRFDRYVSTGSIEYWPDPQRAVAEAYRVLRPGGVAVLAGPLARTHPLARRLSDAWMLFPPEADYRAWMERAGFTDLHTVHVAPAWWDAGWDPYAVAIAGTKPAPGPSPLHLAPLVPEPSGPLTPGRAARFAGGSLAGAAFIPIALYYTLRARLRATRSP
jgi:MPBQ/MSBQ methyltransferase